MGWVSSVIDRVTGGLAGASLGGNAIVSAQEAAESEIGRLKEAASLAELELSQDDIGWRQMAAQGRWEFSRAGLMKIVALSRLMYLLNPLIKRAVTVQELYVWGSGYAVQAQSDVVQEVLDDFFKARRNQGVIGANWPERERDQRIDGNTFFCFYLNKLTGAARVRVMPIDQVETILRNPEDAKEPWYYKRYPAAPDNAEWDATLTPSGPATLYPDIDYNPADRPAEFAGTPINWNVRVLHVKTGGLSTMKFGVPELYSALAWATAYKRILENFATILQAYARLAMKITGLPGRSGVAAAKSKLNTSITGGSAVDKNPPANVASWMMASGNVDVAPIKTAGSTTGPDEARALRSMVAAGTDTPEHFFGDSDVGNFATAGTLDRPTELKMISRQDLWRQVMLQMAEWLIVWSARAPYGKLRQAGYTAEVSRDSFDGTLTYLVRPVKGDSLDVEVAFPTILEQAVTERVRAVVAAATLGGSKAEGIIPDRKVVCKLLLTALGEKEADKMVDLLYPQSVIQGFIDPADEAEDAHLGALGKKAIGDAAIAQSKVAATMAAKPAPKAVSAT